jgi:hypothetical protein
MADHWNDLVEVVRGVETLPRLPGHEARSALQARAVDLHAALRPISLASEEMKRAAEACAHLLGAYANNRVADPLGQAKLYATHLQDQPLFAIRQACDDFRNRRVFDVNSDGDRVYFTLDHAPSAFRLLDQVKKIADAYRAEHWKISRVLKITHIKPENRHISTEEAESVARQIRELAARLGSGLDVERAQERERIRREAQEARDRAKRIIENAARARADETAAHP